MRGKFSPTVSAAYRRAPWWWGKYASSTGQRYVAYDPEGYDSYGYNENDVDRAGNQEYEYYSNDAPFELDLDYNNKYDDALDEWDFDGVKPVRKPVRKT